jgi:hypothetical protein
MSRIDAYRMVRPAHGRHDAVGVERMTIQRSSLSLVRMAPGRGELGDRCHDPPPGRRSVIIASERRQCLRGILPARSSVTSEALSVQAKGGALFTLMRARDLEGIVAKRLNDPYKAQVT